MGIYSIYQGQALLTMEIKEALQALGLSDKESSVYLALLQLRKASAYSISLKSGLKKPTTYVVLDELVKKGLVQRVPRVKKQQYIAISPEQAFGAAEERLLIAKQKLPDLLALTKGETTKVNTLYFEGLSGLKQTMEYGFKDGTEGELVGFYATAKDLPQELTDYFEEWNSKRHKLNIKMLGIVPQHSTLKNYRKSDPVWGREFKTVPYEQLSSEVAIDVLHNYVRIHDYKNLQGIVIENADVAKTVREIFEMLWKRV